MAGQRQSVLPVSDDGVWVGMDRGALTALDGEVVTKVGQFQAMELDVTALDDLLATAPHQYTEEARTAPSEVSFPMPDGRYARFSFVEAPVMHPVLAAKYPQIRTYLGVGIDDPSATVRFDRTPAGFHAQIISPRGWVLIDPYIKHDTVHYVSYRSQDVQRIDGFWHCLVKDDAQGAPAPSGEAQSNRLVATTLMTHRLAVGATGEYTAFHSAGAPTVAEGLAAIVTVMNRVNQITEVELGMHLELIANNDLIVYTDPVTDPYSNGNPSAMLAENQAALDSVIGSANYDQGHAFGTIGGGFSGVAFLSSVCRSNKAQGVSTSAFPMGSRYELLVAHEMGHQFGSPHTFNGLNGNCGSNRTGSTAYEPGSGSTIMAYPGICSADNIQSTPDPFYHHESIRVIRNFMTGFLATCDVVSATANTDPIVSAGSNFTIPQSTPFELTASGSDPDLDPITYSWEERDLGPQAALTAPDDGQIPLVRAWPPVSENNRYIPRLSNLISNTFPLGEKLPTTTRDMVFRVTVRDNVAGNGGTAFDDMTVTVASGAGPFLVTSPNNGTEAWASIGDVTWDVASTDFPPINAATVDILLSTDGGLTYPIVLLAGTPNDGAASVVVPPGNQTTAARVRVQGSNNIFFDISDQDFVLGPQGPLAIVLPNGAPTSVVPGVVTNFDVEITDLEEMLVAGSATLHYRYDGGTFLTAPLVPQGGILFQASLPAALCTDMPEFYVSAQGDGGGTVTEPTGAPATVFSAVVGDLVPTLTETFDASAGSFVYSDGLFRGTENPDAFIDGVFDPAGGQAGGGLHATMGGAVATEMSGGWTIDFDVTGGPADMQIDLSYRLLMAGFYEPGEIAQALISVDGVLIGLNGNDYLHQFEGDGNLPDTAMDTGWRNASFVLPAMATGTHQLAVGGYNNASSFSNEITDVFFDNVAISQFECTSAIATAARSYQQHDCGRLGLNLAVPPNDTGGNIENRQQQGTDIEIDLMPAPAGAVTVTSVDCIDNLGAITDHTASATVASVVGATVNVTFAPALPSNNACKITLDNTASVCIQNLPGDQDRNTHVTTGDFSQTRFFFGTTACISGAQWDYDTAAGITTGDASQIRFFFSVPLNEVPACLP
ncbi:MAG: reprolysin-like metallopeptidase [Phycisphaerae bacterium]